MEAVERKYPVDQGHVGIRVGVLLSLLAAAVISFAVIMPAVSNALSLNGLPELCLTLVGGLALSLAASALAERALQRLWPSGRILVVNPREMFLLQHGEQVSTVVWDQRINILSWRVTNRKERPWAPKGWYCMACQLVQNETALTIYSFAKPTEAMNYEQWAAFEELVIAKPRGREADTSLRRFGEQHQLRIAERDRHERGVELNASQFQEVLTEISTRIPDWPAG